MTLSTNTTYRIFVEKLGATDPNAFVGNEGEVFFDPSIPTLKLSDGSTPGGIGIGTGTASVGTALTVSGDSGSETIDILSETLTIAGGTNLTSSAASDTVTVNLDSDILLDSVIATGIITAIGGFYGDLTGTASIASFATTAFNLNGVVESDLNVAFAQTAGLSTETTKLQTPRNFEITGDVVASPIAFDGTGNVSLAATIQPNSVGLGTDTFGDYVKNISGTANQIDVTGGTGEGSTPTLSFPSQVTIPQDLTVNRDVQIVRNLNVDGNITIGGTSATLFTQTLTVADADLILGVRTDSLGNDISNDTTANHGGIAIASTEGNPLITIVNPGAGETLPATYKKIMWFKSGSFSGLGTDAWLSNYAIGIGSTQFPTGTRLAAGNVQITENDLSVVRNINASGIVAASGGFVGNLTGTASTASFATTAFNLNGVVESDLNVAFAATASVATTAFNLNGVVESDLNVAFASTASFATTAFNLADAANITTGTISSDRLTGSYAIDITGNAGTASTASFATTAFNLNGVVESDLNVAFASTASFATTAFNLADAANITTGTISSDRLTGSYAIDITGNASTASTATEFTVTANNSTNETVYPVFVDAATGSQGAETDAALSYNPSTNTLTAGTFNSTSDRKLKENVKVVKNASELISKLEGVNFTWIETGEKSVGVIAQQVESYIPELVSKNQEVKSVNYNGLVGILIEAFKEQQRQIEELKEVIQNL